MHLPDSTKINIIRGSALVLVLLFFFVPLVRTTEFVTMSLVLGGIGEVSVTGWGFVTGEEIVFESWQGVETEQVVDPTFLKTAFVK